LRPHDRDDLITRKSPVAYEPAATCPRWEAFLARVLGGNLELIAFMQRAVGYSLTGHTGEQVLLMLFGDGANGKSTLIETIRAICGDYATQADFTSFVKRNGEGPRNDLARLEGARFVAAVEADAGKPLSETTLKQITGGDVITARYLFHEYFEFTPRFKLWLACNHAPNISGTDEGIWRRIRLVPFETTIPESERDPDLVAKLKHELPGILAWAVRGAMDWYWERLGAPPEVRTATAEYRREMDNFGPFFDEWIIIDPTKEESTGVLYTYYAEWCALEGRPQGSRTAFGTVLRRRGFESDRRTKGRRVWVGLALRPGLPGWETEGAPPVMEGDG